jgi:hypothetical protein
MLDLGSNLLVNVLAGLILVVLGWVIRAPLRLPFVYRKRDRLLGFFGVTKENLSQTIYLSTVFVTQGGSADFQGDRRTFSGPAVPDYELKAIQPLVQLFDDPFLDGLPVPLRNWLSNTVHWSFRQLSPEILASPRDRNQVRHGGSLITVGSQYYNSAGDLYTETLEPYLRMMVYSSLAIIQVQRGPREGDVIRQDFNATPQDFAILEKLHDHATDTTVFIAAGLGTLGTTGAVYYLARNWHELRQRFGDSPFALCLRFDDIVADPHAHLKPTEVFASGGE